MKILGRNVKVYRNDDVHSGIEFKNRIRNSFDDEGLTFVTDGQVYETSYVETDDRNWDPDGFRSSFIIRNASFVLYKKYRTGSCEEEAFSLYLKEDACINHELVMKIEQYMLELIKRSVVA